MHVQTYMFFHPPSNFSYEMGRTWATAQIASQIFFVQIGGVGPPPFCICIHFVVVYVKLVEASNIKKIISIL